MLADQRKVRPFLLEGRRAKEIAALVNTKGAKDVEEAMLIATDGGTLGEKLTEKVAKIGEKISIRRFARFEMGEGLQKTEENFADEVMKQIKN